MRITLDTNVLISAILFGGPPSTILDLIKDGKAELFLSPFIIDEFQRKLETKFGFTQELAREARAGVEAIANVVYPKIKLTPSRGKTPTTAFWSAPSRPRSKYWSRGT